MTEISLGSCQPCTNCNSSTYLAECSKTAGPGTCQPCSTRANDCTGTQYLQGCGSGDEGSCTGCPSCSVGEYRSNCAKKTSSGGCSNCTNANRGQYYTTDGGTIGPFGCGVGKEQLQEKVLLNLVTISQGNVLTLSRGSTTTGMVVQISTDVQHKLAAPSLMEHTIRTPVLRLETLQSVTMKFVTCLSPADTLCLPGRVVITVPRITVLIYLNPSLSTRPALPMLQGKIQGRERQA